MTDTLRSAAERARRSLQAIVDCGVDEALSARVTQDLAALDAALARAGEPLPTPGSPEASAMMDSVLAEYGWPANPKNAARAGFEAARRLLAAPPAPAPQTPPGTELPEPEVTALSDYFAADGSRHSMAYSVDQMRAALSAPAAAPGWKLVPKKPTPLQLQILETMKSAQGDQLWAAFSLYSELLAASPEPQR